MKSLGLVLMMLGFFASAFVAVRRADSENLGWHTVEWGWYLASFLVGVIGVVVLRVTARGVGTQARKVAADMQTMERSLGALVGKLQTFNTHRDEISVFDVHDKLDEQLLDDLGAFVEARESLIHQYGLQSYADLMSRFASAERSINRAWSASADGYIDEVWICMDQAEKQMEQARSLLASYQSRSA